MAFWLVLRTKNTVLFHCIKRLAQLTLKYWQYALCFIDKTTVPNRQIKYSIPIRFQKYIVNT